MEQYIIDFTKFVANKELHSSDMNGDTTLRVYKVDTKVNNHGRHTWYAFCRDIAISPLCASGEVHLPVEENWRETWFMGKSNKYFDTVYMLDEFGVTLRKSDKKEAVNTNHDLRKFITWWASRSIETAQDYEARSPRDAIRFCRLDDKDFYGTVPPLEEYYCMEVK